MKRFILLLTTIVTLAATASVIAAEPTTTAPTFEKPKMYYGDATQHGRAFTKDPAVVKYKGTYFMYYSVLAPNGENGYGIAIAKSDDLTSWTRVCDMEKEPGEVEEKGFCAPGAIVLNNKIHLFYQSYGNGAKDAICHAWSTDGIHFTRNPTNPIFRPTGDWNCGRAIDADVIEHDGKLFLYWSTRDQEFKKQLQGVSTAPIDSDFARDKWTQRCDTPILAPELPWEKTCIEAAAMAKHNDKLYMFYAGAYNNSPQQIGCAVSEDGIKFKRLFIEEPFLPCGKKGTWNSSESGHPFAFQDEDGKTHLFYQGNNDKGRTWFLSRLEIKWDRNGIPYAVKP